VIRGLSHPGPMSFCLLRIGRALGENSNLFWGLPEIGRSPPWFTGGMSSARDRTAHPSSAEPIAWDLRASFLAPNIWTVAGPASGLLSGEGEIRLWFAPHAPSSAASGPASPSTSASESPSPSMPVPLMGCAAPCSARGIACSVGEGAMVWGSGSARGWSHVDDRQTHFMLAPLSHSHDTPSHQDRFWTTKFTLFGGGVNIAWCRLLATLLPTAIFSPANQPLPFLP
jgi:hypothetical protein